MGSAIKENAKTIVMVVTAILGFAIFQLEDKITLLSFEVDPLWLSLLAGAAIYITNKFLVLKKELPKKKIRPKFEDEEFGDYEELE